MVGLSVVQLAPRPVSIQDNSSIREVQLERQTWNPFVPVNQSLTQEEGKIAPGIYTVRIKANFSELSENWTVDSGNNSFQVVWDSQELEMDFPFDVVETGMHFEDCRVEFQYFMDAPYTLDYCKIIQERMQITPQRSQSEPGTRA